MKEHQKYRELLLLDLYYRNKENKWKYLKGAECLYSIRYLEDRTFSIRKCEITEDMHNRLVNQ